MQFSLSTLIVLLPALALGASTATTTTAAAVTGTPICVYSSLPSATAYAAFMPNPNLTSAKIENYFENFSFACMPGRNFSTRQLAQSGKPWFGGDVQSSPNCTPDAFASLVDFAMEDSNENKQYSVQCTEYKGGDSNDFQKAAKAYFASLT